MKYIKIFDRSHNPLAEITTYLAAMTYGWTLDDVDTLTFSLSLTDLQCTPANAQFFNHVELWDDTTGLAVWGGQIAGQDFLDSALKLNCLDYGSLMKWRRLRAKTYGPTDYGSLTSQMITDTNAISSSGVTLGNIATGALQTTKPVANTDNLLADIKAFNAELSYDWDVDLTRKYNFYLRKGADKPQYSLTWGGDADNIIVAPEMAIDALNMANSEYAEVTSPALTSLQQDAVSQGIYGLVEGSCMPSSGTAAQAVLDNQTVSQLQKSNYPMIGFTLTAVDSPLCPFNNLIVGDAVTVNLKNYFNYSGLLRILRMIHDEDKQQRQIFVGDALFKPVAPVKKIYLGC